jgi:ribonuclease D
MSSVYQSKRYRIGSADVWLHQHDLPEHVHVGEWAAIDSEALGLNNRRDRLCVVQVCTEEGSAHCVQIHRDASVLSAPNLCRIMEDSGIQKILHFARFDLGLIQHTFNIKAQNVFCTRIASKLARTNTESHSLKTLCNTLLGVSLSKEETGSYWGAESLDEKQLRYAADDVLYLQRIQQRLLYILEREGRLELARRCMEAVPLITDLEAEGWSEAIFAF